MEPMDVMFLHDTHHGGAADQAATVARRLAGFLAAASVSLDVAIYDFRLSDALAAPVVDALTAAAARGVQVRIAFDAGKPATATPATFAALQADPAPPGTGEWVAAHFGGTKVATKPIKAPSGQLMHSKYVVRDAGHPHAAVWTGSANFTDDAWTRQENNVLTVVSAALATSYRADFDQLWDTGSIKLTGGGDAGHTTAAGVELTWDFAPADGAPIDAFLVSQVDAAAHRIVLATMVLTSHPLLSALTAAVARGVPVSGMYDAGQMGPIAATFAHFESSAGALADWKTVSPHLVGKHSIPYTPTSVHDFMHHKVLVADNTVVTGSYNLSANAQKNAENQLHIHNKKLADRYTSEIASLVTTYS